MSDKTLLNCFSLSPNWKNFVNLLPKVYNNPMFLNLFGPHIVFFAFYSKALIKKTKKKSFKTGFKLSRIIN